jgi:hypothetical protein
MNSSSNEVKNARGADGSVAQDTTAASVEEIVSRIEQEHRALKPRFPMFTFSEHEIGRIRHQIDQIVDGNPSLPNGKGSRSKLSPLNSKRLKLDVLVAAGFAASLVVKGPLKNQICGRGRPPDNTTFVLIDDLMRACQRAGLKPGLRFVSGSESLPVRLYVALAPLLGFGKSKNPRRLFERWQRLRSDLVRQGAHPSINPASIDNRGSAGTRVAPAGSHRAPTRRKF